MPVVFKTNSDIFQQQIVMCVNAICALRNQLPDLTDAGVRMAIETSIVKISTRLDSLMEAQANWNLPKLDNQDIAAAKFEQERRMAEYALWAQEVQKQVALGNIQYTPAYVPTVEAESVPSTKQSRTRRKKK